jgi:hypothetical protein
MMESLECRGICRYSKGELTLAQLIAYPGIERGEPIIIEHKPKKLQQL